jgi:hypothetical protein
MSDKPSKLEIFQAFVVFGLFVAAYTVVNRLVINLFWKLVIKLYDTIVKK